MRLVTFRERGSDASRVGAVAGDRIAPLDNLVSDMIDLIAEGGRTLEAARSIANGGGATIALADVELRAPIERPRRNIVCVGLNYAEHVAESKSVAGADAPKRVVFFTKPPTCVIGPDSQIPWHPHVSTSIDWEAELAVIIGKECRDVDEASALDCIFGYTAANDVTARDLQSRHQQWYKGKGLDGFCPLGPAIVTRDEIGDAQALDIASRVNGVTKQQANTRQMIFNLPRLISEWSAGMTLLPGDILLTGTPSGVGIGRTPPEFLKPGDIVEVEIEGIGVLRNTVGGRGE
jgi:2-keto-4-pentenoate hydratase/2-oxohepta-3-ene-1,7-dioic acid hydratase in catechol pathway